MQEKQKKVEEKDKFTLKIGLVGLKNMTSSALSHYLVREHFAEVTILDAYPKPELSSDTNADFDILLLDANKYGLNDLKSLTIDGPQDDGPKIAIYCCDRDPNFVRAAFKYGAKGVITTDTNVEALPSILNLISSGHVFVPASVITSGPLRGENDIGGNHPLADIQITTLRMVSDGLTNKEIALKLAVSEMHIKMILRNIGKALNAKNRAHAVAKAMRQGLI